jgi:wyosine [tRNA(Phe)-imidazoG37] synthetase (radical SAM superfamily)
MILELKKGLTYGPVRSRRLGASLGINLFPGDVKRCPFDCVYCQYGWTPETAVRLNRADVPLPTPGEVEKALVRALESLQALPAYLTFSGNGEPTLHPDFPEMVDRVAALRSRFGGGMRTAVLSNSARILDDDVRAALVRLDVRIMKLDCGSEEVFRRYNRPVPGLCLEAITAGLRTLAGEAPVTVQSLFAAGTDGNMNEANEAGWVGRLVVIRPAAVQLYTLDRGHPAGDLRPAARADLLRLADEAGRTGVPVTVFP